MGQVFQLELYPLPLPETCQKLVETEVFPQLFAVGKYQIKVESDASQPAVALRQYLEEQNLAVYIQHLEVIVEPDFNWQAARRCLSQQFKHLAWLNIGVESIGTYDIYSFEFIPVTHQTAGGPLALNLAQYLKVHYPRQSDPSGQLITEFAACLNQSVCWGRSVAVEAAGSLASAKVPAKAETELQHSGEIQDAMNPTHLLNELKNAHNAKERMALANQKLELLMQQIENYNMQRSMDDLMAGDYIEKDWAKWLKINLQEYTILLQKARFLEELWRINHDLETRIERMTVSENQLTYEREQVKRLKEHLGPHEIYLVLDECQEIQKRCRVRYHVLFGKPFAKIMRMDYESLKRKAQYFDLLQGENTLFQQTLQTEKGA